MFSFIKNNRYTWIVYYIILGVIQCLWTNPSAFPPMPLRLIMMTAVFAPMFLKKELAVFGIPFFMILKGQLCTEYQYLPDIHSYIIYIPLIIILLLIHCRNVSFRHISAFIPLIGMIIYMFTIDILGTSSCGKYVINLFIALLFSFFITTGNDRKFLTISLLSVCSLLAIYYLCLHNSFLETWNVDEGIERSGWNDPNYFSTLLGIGILISSLHLLDYIKTDFFLYNKLFLTVFISLTYLAIVLTASRAGFISSSLVLIFVIIKSRPRFSTILASVFFISTMIAVMYRLGAFDTLLYRIFEQGNLDTGGERTTIWVRVLQNFNNQGLIQQLFGGGYWHRAKLSGGFDMHNEFIAILADYGYVGILFFASLIFSMLYRRDETFNVRLLSTLYYILIIISLSPFQFINVGFFIVWILSSRVKLNSL